MNSLAINPIRRSKFFALTAAFALATVLFPARPTNAQQLRQGVSVQLAVTSNAAMYLFFQHEGSTSDGRFETEAAVRTGNEVGAQCGQAARP